VKQVIRYSILLALAMAITATAAQAQDLDGALSRFASAWRRNDYKAIASLIAREGASIETDAGRLGPLGSRQAAAVLRALFSERNTTQVRTRQLQDVGGDPQKGYAELVWTTKAPATTETLRVIVFVEFVQESDRAWRVSRIRLLPP
jgi:hypothetical protein